MACASTSLPVPVSPSSRTVESVCATCPISSSTLRKRGDLPIRPCRRPDLGGVLEVGVLALEAVLQNLDFRHGAQKLFLLALSRDGMRKHVADELQPCNQIVRPARVSRKAAKAMAPMIRPPMRNGMLRCECIPVRRTYSASPTASGGRSSAGFVHARNLASREVSQRTRKTAVEAGPVASGRHLPRRSKTARQASRLPGIRQRCCDRNREIAEVWSAQPEFRIGPSRQERSQIARRDRRACARTPEVLPPTHHLLFGAGSDFDDLLRGMASGTGFEFRSRSQKTDLHLTALVSERPTGAANRNAD